jgi:hypothetical protein
VLTNEELLQILKATISTGLGGLASAQDTDEFITLAVEQTEVLQQIRVETGIRTSMNLDALNIGEPTMVAATEATAPSAGDVVTPGHERKTLTPVEVLTAFDVSFDWLRKNIEAGSAEQTLNQEFAKRWGKDTVILTFNGDDSETGTTRYQKLIKILDGIIVQAKADANIHEVTVSGNDYLAIFTQLLAAMPKDYKDDRAMLRLFLSANSYDGYEDQVGGRPTALGDRILVGSGRLPWKSIALQPVFGYPDDHFLLTPSKNIAVGYGHDMDVGRFLNQRKRVLEVTITGSLDTKYAVSDAVVLGAP